MVVSDYLESVSRDTETAVDPDWSGPSQSASLTNSPVEFEVANLTVRADPVFEANPSSSRCCHVHPIHL